MLHFIPNQCPQNQYNSITISIRQNMNFLKSAIQKGLKKKDYSLTNQEIQKKKTIYEDLKQWDKKRAKLLETHLRIIHEILKSLEQKVHASDSYLTIIQTIMQNRLKELQEHNINSINNSTFVLMNNQIPSYNAHYQLLKEFVMMQSQLQQEIKTKFQNLRLIFGQFCKFKQSQMNQSKSNQFLTNSPTKRNKMNASQTSIQNNQEQPDQQNQGLDQSSVAILKSNVRYLIDCELEDIVQQVLQSCSQISKIYHKQVKGDIYIAICKFVSNSNRQLLKHRQISKELLNLISEFVQRQKQRSVKLKITLSKWLIQDQNANQLLTNQLKKAGNQMLIDDYYSIQDMVNQKYVQLKQKSVQDYLKFIIIKPFQSYQSLKLFGCQCFYNKKVQTQLIVTVDRYFHLRKPHHIEPQFSFLLSSQIYVKEGGQFVYEFCKKSKELFRSATQKQFQFSIQFNLKEQKAHLKTILQKIGLTNFIK